MVCPLTKKEWDVLLYFIKNEGYAPIRLSADGGINAGGSSYVPFISYPARIEHDLGDVSRGWAAKICRGFESRGIVDKVMVRPPRQKHETEHYYLKRDLPALRAIVQLVLEHARPEDRHSLFSYRYFRGMLDESLVRKVLREKNVEMWRTIGLDYWDTKDAGRLYAIYSKSPDFYGYVRSSLYEVPDDSPQFDEISLRLPVFSDEVPVAVRAGAFERLNRSRLGAYPFIRFDSSGIADHYSRREREKLILPILALIQISPNAMAEFLMADWAPSGTAPLFSPEGTGMMEYILFRLLFMAINDLAAVRSIEGDGVARMAWIRKSNNVLCESGGDALFTVSLGDGHLLFYDGGFDTFHDFLEPDDDPEQREGLDYWVRTWRGFDAEAGRGVLLGEGDVKPAELVRRLLKPGDPLAEHIRGKLSFGTLRRMECADLTVPMPETLKMRLIDELNEAILGECLYDARAFSHVEQSDNTRKLMSNMLQNEKCPPCENYSLNRALLHDAFPGIIAPGYV